MKLICNDIDDLLIMTSFVLELSWGVKGTLHQYCFVKPSKFMMQYYLVDDV